MARKPKQCSAITNGSRLFLSPGNGNSEEARRYRDLFEEAVRERGGAESMNLAAREACRAWAGLAVQRQRLHDKLAAGEPIDDDALVKIGGQMARELRLMGKPVEAPKPTMRSHFDAKRTGRTSA